MHKVMIQQAILPPYRLRVFQGLCASKLLDVTVAFGRSDPRSALVSLQQPSGVKAIQLKNRFFGRGPAVTWQHGIKSSFVKHGFDTVIASFDPRILSNRGLFARAKRNGGKVILWGHGIRPSGRFVSLYRKMALAADAVILYTGEGKRRLEAEGVPSEKIFVAWNSIDTRRIEALRSDVPLKDRPNILFIGRLIAEKKPLLLLEGFAQALDRLPDSTRLVFVGKGPEREVIERQAEILGVLNRIDMAGEIYHEEQVAKYMNDAWVSVSPGYVGLSAIHSLAYGVPMLVADDEPHSPEVEALRAGTNCIFFTSNSLTSLGVNLVKLQASPDVLESLGQAGKVTAKGFSVESMVETFEQAVAYTWRTNEP